MLTSVVFMIAAAVGQQAASPSIADGDKIVCKSERSVGTNLSSRVCKTKAKWAQERDSSREDYQNDVNSRAGGLKPDGWYKGAMPTGGPSGPAATGN